MALIGLDLSTRAAAAVACPLNWDGDWQRLRSTVVGEPLSRGASEVERIDRCVRIGVQLTRFAKECDVDAAFIEGYAYGQASAAHSLGELGGLVRLGLMRAGIGLYVANMGSARKLMCGTIKRGTDPKEVVKATLQRADAPTWLTESHDLCDAFVCVNWGLSELGGFCFCQAA
jgi:hypothetical protein